MNTEYQEIIDNYVLGKMTTEELKSFEEELAINQELREQYGFTLQVKNAITSRQEKLKLLKFWEEHYPIEQQYRPTGTDLDNGKHQNYHSSPKKKIVWFSSIAAVLIIGFFALRPSFFVSPSKPNEIPVEGEIDVIDVGGFDDMEMDIEAADSAACDSI